MNGWLHAQQGTHHTTTLPHHITNNNKKQIVLVHNSTVRNIANHKLDYSVWLLPNNNNNNKKSKFISFPFLNFLVFVYIFAKQLAWEKQRRCVVASFVWFLIVCNNNIINGQYSDIGHSAAATRAGGNLVRQRSQRETDNLFSSHFEAGTYETWRSTSPHHLSN